MNGTSILPGEKAFILIVEDSAPQANFLRLLLEAAGCEVAHAVHGADALDLLELRRPALVISDVMMPVMNGYDLCRQIKAGGKFQAVPFMLLTSLSEPQDIFKGLESGADFYSIKPYDGTVLMNRVRNILAGAGAPPASNAQPGMDVNYDGHKYSIQAGRSQILDLLLATFENIVRKNNELVQTNQKLSEALEANKTLRGLIPICGYCKKVRNDGGYWDQVESFMAKHSEARFSHGICPQCFDKTMAELGLKEEIGKSQT